jgi:type IV pilus assembly protein PilY1
MRTFLRALAALMGLLLTALANAGTTDIANIPLEMGATSSAKPNVMLLFDDSGSMSWDFMPDWIGPSPLPGSGVDKPRCNGGGGGGGGKGGGGACTPSTTTGLQGDPPYYAFAFNGIYYNPGVYYPPGVDYTGTPMKSYTDTNSSLWTHVPVDAYGVTGGNINLVTGFPEAVFCKNANDTPPSANCKRNGVDTGSPFLYNLGAAGNGYPDAVLNSVSGTVNVTLNGSDTIKITPGTYEYAAVQYGNPFYYRISAAEVCSDSDLTTCVLANSSGAAAYVNPAPIRYCYLAADQNSTSAVSGSFTAKSGPLNGKYIVRCQKKYNQRLGYQYPRFGNFIRYDIVPSTVSYPKSLNRVDCAAANYCSYAEEMTNFANWYAYYHNRIQMAKTAVGLAFNTLTSSYRVGFITINAYASGGLTKSMFLPIGDFSTTQKQSFYSSFYALNAANGTPLREALSRVGQYYAGLTSKTALDYGMINKSNYPDPVLYSCQQNFTILTTDGYWNGNSGQDLGGATIDYNTTAGNQDNDPNDIYELRNGPNSTDYGSGIYDGNLANTKFNNQTYTSKGTLADVAEYYYKTDLRPAGSANYNSGVDVSKDNVPTAAGDMNPTQHMVTFTIGMGIDGYLTYDTSSSDPSHLSYDFTQIVAGNNNCVWAPGLTCDWPQVPTGTGYNDDPAKDDDLWHAAINGRGSYLSAKSPQALLRGLSKQLATIQAKVGAAAASATSTPNITQNDNYIFSTTFETVLWTGELDARTIDVASGLVQNPPKWQESLILNPVIDPKTGAFSGGMVSAASDSRTIYTMSAGSLVPFSFGSLDAAAQAWFKNKCIALSQCSSLDVANQAIVNSGDNLINYLRGQAQYAEDTHFRSRTSNGVMNVLGDLVSSRPVVVRDPRRHYSDAPIPPGNQTYSTYAATYASREGVIYIGANDGMLHAFDALTGVELWAYVPRMLLPQMYQLSDISYPTQHRFYVDGSPEVVDILSPSDGLWHTILIEGLNAGGRGYFAFDVTNPTSPVFLWELCSDSTICTSHSDSNLGLSFGNPVGVKRAYDNKWVILFTSGYNNVSSGDGMGHLYEVDPFSGAILRQASTGTGSVPTPSGLSKITAFAKDPDVDDTVQYVYGGDLQGNLWKFDLKSASIGVSKMATLLDANGKQQPITTRPEIGEVNGYPVIYVGTGRYLGVSDLQDPATLVPAGNWSYQTSMYALYDNGTALGNPRANGTIVKQTFTSINNNTQRTVTQNPVNIPTNIGWYVDFPTTGERVNVDPILALGTLFVATNVPDASSAACSAGGDSWLYQFNYATGTNVAGSANNVVGTFNGGALIVGMTLINLSNSTSSSGGGSNQVTTGSLKVIPTLSNGQTPTDTANVAPSSTVVRRVGWREFPQ